MQRRVGKKLESVFGSEDAVPRPLMAITQAGTAPAPTVTPQEMDALQIQRRTIRACIFVSLGALAMRFSSFDAFLLLLAALNGFTVWVFVNRKGVSMHLLKKNSRRRLTNTLVFLGIQPPMDESTQIKAD